jgi:hypothetical protein
MNIITNHVLYNEEAPMNNAIVDQSGTHEESMEEYLDERFNDFMQAIADDGLASIKDIFYNGMQTMLDIMNIAVGDANEESSVLAVMELVEEALSNKVINGEIDLDYTNSENNFVDDTDDIDIDMYDDIYDDDNDSDEEADDTFETAKK